MIVGFFGIAGVGKTTLSHMVIKRLPDFKAYSASQLIKRSDGEVRYDKLSSINIKSNQSKLIACANELKLEFPFSSFILELHNVIETDSGDIFIPEFVFESIHIDKAFFIFKNPIDIYRQRILDSKQRAAKSVEEINVLQNKSLMYFEHLFPKEIRIKLDVNGSSPDEVANMVYHNIKN